MSTSYTPPLSSLFSRHLPDLSPAAKSAFLPHTSNSSVSSPLCAVGILLFQNSIYVPRIPQGGSNSQLISMNEPRSSLVTPLPFFRTSGWSSFPAGALLQFLRALDHPDSCRHSRCRLAALVLPLSPKSTQRNHPKAAVRPSPAPKFWGVSRCSVCAKREACAVRTPSPRLSLLLSCCGAAHVHLWI